MGLQIEHPGLKMNQERVFFQSGAPDLPLESGKWSSAQSVEPDIRIRPEAVNVQRLF
jgi:hypothetical protein